MTRLSFSYLVTTAPLLEASPEILNEIPTGSSRCIVEMTKRTLMFSIRARKAFDVVSLVHPLSCKLWCHNHRESIQVLHDDLVFRKWVLFLAVADF